MGTPNSWFFIIFPMRFWGQVEPDHGPRPRELIHLSSQSPSNLTSRPKNWSHGAVSHGCVWKWTTNIYIYPQALFFEGNWWLANWMIATHLNLGGCPFSDTCEFPRTQHWPDRIHVGILLGSFSKIVTIVLENLLYFFVGKCITEGMGNRGVIHKAGSFWIWLPKLRSKPHWNWNGMQILANVGLSRMNLPFGDSLYHPFVVIWELVYAWVCHSTQIGIFFSSWNPFSTRGSRTCWDHFLIELWWSAKLSGLTTREYMALYPPKKYPQVDINRPLRNISIHFWGNMLAFHVWSI